MPLTPMKSLFLAVTFALLGGYGEAKEITGHHHHGDRAGGHGWSLFGEQAHYLAHIPMLTRPHNEQLILHVVLKDAAGQTIANSFAAAAHSFRPASQLSLDDIALGRQLTIPGNIHRGNFEHGGEEVHSQVTAEIKSVIVARNLDNQPSGHEAYLIQEKSLWLVGRITESHNRQVIQRIQMQGALPTMPVDSALKVTLAPGGEGGAIAFLPRAGSNEGSSFVYQVANQLWCLQGPDFFQNCP